MSELEEYKSQLDDVEETLKQDLDNTSLRDLKKELQDLIALLSQEEQAKEPSKPVVSSPEGDKFSKSKSLSHSASPSIPDYKVGDVVYVKNKLDKEFKAVKISTISGNNKLITVRYQDDETKIDTFPVEEVYESKPKLNKYRLKQQKSENKELKSKESEQEMNKSVQSWKTFNSKKSRKKAVNDKSQFKTSDTVGSRVGVVNSGKPMTEAKRRERSTHRYNPY